MPSPVWDATLSSPAPERSANARSGDEGAPPAAFHSWRWLLHAVSQTLASHGVLALAGLVTLPVLARNFGPGEYGGFSLFLTLLAVVSYQDFVRPLLVREHLSSAEPDRCAELSALSSSTTWILAALAACVGFSFFPATAAVPFTLAVACHGLASTDYARLNARGKIGPASAIRNSAWAGALLLTGLLSFRVRGAHAYAWSLLAANLVTWIGYRTLAVRSNRVSAPSRRANGFAAWKASVFRAWSQHGRSLAELLGFNLASGVICCADRLILRASASEAELGIYAGCADLVLKLDVIGTVLATVLYPLWTHRVKSEGLERTTREFVQKSTWILSGSFALALLLILYDRELVNLVLGRAFEPAHGLCALMLVGIFVHVLGYLLTPWQRARGDFASQRRAYGLSAVMTVLMGLALIPPLGALGAVLTYLSSRVAELVLLAVEVRTLPRAALPRWRIAAVVLMIVALLAVALLRAGGPTGGLA